MITNDYIEKMMHQFAIFGEMMMTNGAETYRVEDSINWMCKSLGYERTDIYATPSNIILSIERPDGFILTETRRIKNNGTNELRKIEKLNALSREFCRNRMEPDEFARRLDEIDKIKLSKPLLYLSGIIITASFTIFFGGNWKDGLVAAIVSVFITFLQPRLSRIFSNTMIYDYVIALVAGLMICCVVNIVPDLNMGKIIVGDIMLVVPGIAMTNSVRDILIGDTNSGVARFVESTLWAVALACGFMTAMWIVM